MCIYMCVLSVCLEFRDKNIAIMHIIYAHINQAFDLINQVVILVMVSRHKF